MARQISSGLLEPGASMIAAHNETHRSVVALESAKPHYDGPEWIAGVEQVLTQFYPTTISVLAEAINCTEQAIALWDGQHSNRHNSSSGLKIYAHKLTGTLIGGTVGSAGAVLEAAMVTAWGPVVIELLTILKNHMANVGGTWHATADTFNSVGTLPASITTKAELCSWVIVLFNVYLAHIAYGDGVQHTSLDSTNTLSADPPDNSDDFDDMLAVLIDVAEELEDHVEDGTFHNAVMSVTPSVAAFPAAVSTAFTRINLYKSTHNSDLGSTSIHHAADATYTLTSADATTIATYVTLAEEIRTDQTGHFRNAPVTSAQRGV